MAGRQQSVEDQRVERRAIALPMLLVLAGLSAVPPLSFDMYLPALPDIARDLGVSESQVQLTLSACLLGIALGQLFGGPVTASFSGGGRCSSASSATPCSAHCASSPPRSPC